MRVLAVDDDTVARMAMHGMVTSFGHECLLARSGEQAWHLLRQGNFDVLITDRVMPEMDGLELCRAVRTDDTTRSGYLYIVLASALSDEDQIRDGILAGADDYLAKPLRVQELERKLIAAERVTSLHHQLLRMTDDLRLTTLRDAETKRRLSEANLLQADMMAMLSHDARQPLTAVIGFVDATIEEWGRAPDAVKLANLTRASAAARRLDHLIEDVLTMGHLDSGRVSCRQRPVTVATSVNEAITASGQPEVEIRGDLAAQASVDPWHLRQILTNLIANATKYGAAPITATIEAGPEVVSIAIDDKGEGVPEQFVPRLFDRYSRAETGVATQRAGTGFGLYIVRQLTEANGGRIGYHRGEPRGSRFTVTLPAA